ncbi:hypothetical protein [Sorangium cellulosum]|uniref:hypothetical protein n=1 Tax=Sorangium cellulosum TaxID=56 RepID=UPI0012DB2E7F|nr:hypothetical protein [Sorangium cellulosum]
MGNLDTVTSEDASGTCRIYEQQCDAGGAGVRARRRPASSVPRRADELRGTRILYSQSTNTTS